MRHLRRTLAAVSAGVLTAGGAAAAEAASEYSFDLSEIEAKTYEFSGFVEARAEHFRLRRDAALSALSFAGQPPRRTLDRGTAAFELAARARRDIYTGYGRINGSAATDAYTSSSTGAVLEAGVRASPAEGLSFDIGKQVQRWGKGYAWNPVAFFERTKDPNDPALAREGFVMAAADWVKSLQGSVAAVGFTPVLLPVSSQLNAAYGAAGNANLGARLYLLVADTDIDLLWAAQGSRPQRLGLDFSRNLGSQFELHGEWARAIDAPRRSIADDGSVSTDVVDTDSWLLGARYLTENEITWIAELYRNGGGQDETQLATFHDLLQRAFGPGGTPQLQAQARALAQAGYARNNPGRRYAYLRVSAKDPFDWLYLSASLTGIVNLDDHSHQLTPELLYTGWQDVELRLRAVVPDGRSGSEFGEKAAAQRLELALKLFF